MNAAALRALRRETGYRHAMLRWVVRAGLIRFVGRKAIPVLIVYDAVQLVRTVRRRARRSDRAPDRKPQGPAR